MSEESSSTIRNPSGSAGTVRGRGGFRSQELVTVPEGMKSSDLKGVPTKFDRQVTLLSNYIRIRPMKERHIYQYRVEFEPNVESVSLRRRLFNRSTETILDKGTVYDGVSDARSSTYLSEEVKTVTANHPTEPDTIYTITIKRVGQVPWGSFEMLRVYNMNMKHFLRLLGFFQVTQTGSWVHPDLVTPIGENGSIVSVRGYKTAVNVHDENEILMNLESVHKLLQKRNVLQLMNEIRLRCGGSNLQEACRSALVQKLVVTNYNKIVYRIEDINFNLNPESTFLDRRTGQQVTYSSYFKSRYDVTIAESSQPLLLVVQNNKRKQESDQEQNDIYIVPELCNIAGLTDEQRRDNRLKFELIKTSQIPPKDRIVQLESFLKSLNTNAEVKTALNKWGYSYEDTPLTIQARTLPLVRVGVGELAKQDPNTWKQVAVDSSFENNVINEKLAKIPEITKLAVVISRPDKDNENNIMTLLSDGFKKLGMTLGRGNVEFRRIQEDKANDYISALRSLGKDIKFAIVIFPRQNKQNYDAVKKVASAEMGLITQVVTSKLMMDQRKNRGAATKIGIQIAAKIGGEPWHIYLPTSASMVCGYDTYHDSTDKNRSFGAFVASMNRKLSNWFSKADCHNRIEELSTNMATNFEEALKRYKELNGKLPEMVFIYRDGVGDGQLEHVYNTELKQVKNVLDKVDSSITLTFIVVNKRIGARFYMKTNNFYTNPESGTVVDSIVTKKGRFDFYLISASTRQGTISPTYYNIIYDESPLSAANHQTMAHKLCFLYYNWTGAVRVPAPVQYAHKLALLCGEHLHRQPTATLDDRLHFL